MTTETTQTKRHSAMDLGIEVCIHGRLVHVRMDGVLSAIESASGIRHFKSARQQVLVPSDRLIFFAGYASETDAETDFKLGSGGVTAHNPLAGAQTTATENLHEKFASVALHYETVTEGGEKNIEVANILNVEQISFFKGTVYVRSADALIACNREAFAMIIATKTTEANNA